MKVTTKKKRKMFAHWQLYVMVIPAVVYLIVFAYKPMYGLIIAFKDFSFKKGIWGSEWVGFEHFVRLFDSYWFPIMLKNTLIFSLIGLVLGFPINIMFALLVNEAKGKYKNLVQTISYAPHFISVVVMCGMVILMLSPDGGILNTMLKLLGMDPVYFMQKPKMFKWILFLSGVWQNTGWNAIIYIAALSGVDQNLVEAAEIDGASRIKKIIHIYFPVLVPTIVILLIMNCGNILNVNHEKVLALQNTANLTGSEVISTYVYKVGLNKRDFSFATAVGLLTSAVNSLLLVSVNAIARRVNDSSLW